MERRELLKRAAVVGAAGLTGAVGITLYRRPSEEPDDATPTPRETTTPPETEEDVSPPTEETPVRHQSEFDTVVDAVEAGADPEGEEPIGDFLEQYADDDTLLTFRTGSYRFPQIELNQYDHLGLAAAHEEHPTFVAEPGSCKNSDPHVQFSEVTDFLLEGIDFDFTADGAGGAINVIAEGDATVREVNTVGTCETQVTMFRIDIRDPDGTGLVEEFTAENDQESGWMTGAYVGQRHSGEVTFKNCELSDFSDNGLYGSAPGASDGGGGVVHTEGGSYRNNNVSNIRLGTQGSTASGDSIVVESAPKAESINLRGIRFRRGAEQEVQDCEIRFGPDVTESFGAVLFHRENGGARMADSTITMDSDGIPALRAFYHSGDSDIAPVFENLTVNGSASRGYTARINGRHGTTFRNCTIEQTGNHRDGIRIAYSDDCEIVDSRIEVDGYPLILRDSKVRIRNTTFVTPDGERHVDEMDAGPGDFRPGSWA